jgi:hypothetical protein
MSRILSTWDVWSRYQSEIMSIVADAQAHGGRAEGFFGAESRIFGVARALPDGGFSFRWLGPSESGGTVVLDAEMRHPRAVAA